jgi:hypothetical protein
VSRLLALLLGAGGEAQLPSRLGRWRAAVSTALGPWETSLPMPWPGDLCTGPLLDGAVRSVEPAGSLYPDRVTWRLGAVELLRTSYTRDAAGLVTSLEWRVRTTAGDLVMTITDAISYSGLVETSRTRTVAL